MSYIYVGVGGTGAKLLQALVHLAAAGLLPASGRELTAFLVDPDEPNGNVRECLNLCSKYAECKKIQFGDDAALFKNNLRSRGPWTPVEDDDKISLDTIFHYDPDKQSDQTETDLMDLFFAPEERKLSVKQGFRGRPAIGAAVLAHTIDFDQPFWTDLKTSALNARAHKRVSIVLGGSVFGGSGAAGVPTISKLLRQELISDINDDQLTLAVALFLPYFTYDKVKRKDGDEEEIMQADPQTFAMATAEALKYYDESNFLDICKIYALGERHRAKMPRPAVGSKDQLNPAHFLELIAALGAIRFWREEGDQSNKGTVNLVSREKENTVRWSDLPETEEMQSRLQQFILFSVAFHYVLCPYILKNLHRHTVLHSKIDAVVGDYSGRPTAGDDMKTIDAYVTSFLNWLIEISTPLREGADEFVPGLVDVRVFAARDNQQGWRLKEVFEFKQKQLPELFVNLEVKRKPNLRAIWRGAARVEKNLEATGAGRLVRAIYENCKV